MLSAVFAQHSYPTAAQACLQRSRLVVQPSVDDTAVVAGLVQTDLGLLLEHDHLGVAAALKRSRGGRQPEEPAPTMTTRTARRPD